ncbi:peptidase C39 [Verminephrobacter eiseniae]|nr:peptidase C39 [Verminephrobacter sp. Larva24]MCW5231634.1 peptidase C39 [Verminephrobacter eiseniae]MCW5293365.1 peptidase C39 [Verminephrobacter eiseniae]MCW8186318.1 peptidase C39 [Verminephrobacter eiseniae]MCW8224771.1 peptidase C39 [Verminephrobacter eiseniae]
MSVIRSGWTLACCALLLAAPARADDPAKASGPEAALLATHSAHGLVPLKSWKTLRDERIVKQDLDYSCGAASLATLLNSHYGQNLTEAALLQAMDKGDGRASFEDMARALPQFGFRAQGFAASWEQLARLKMPVVVYVKQRKDEHFAVLRGISSDTVWLADPSLGNRTYSRAQFLDMWQTRADAEDGLAGKFLAVLPADAANAADAVDRPSSGDFFTKAPRRINATAQLAFRTQP